MNESQLRVHAVWDAPVRWFHWINVICVIIISGLSLVTIYHNELALEREARDLLKTLHVYVGYVFTANLVWRIIWAFCGNRFARWKAMLPFGRGYGKAALGYVASLRTEHPRQYLGHNPLGRLAVAALFDQDDRFRMDRGQYHPGRSSISRQPRATKIRNIFRLPEVLSE